MTPATSLDPANSSPPDMPFAGDPACATFEVPAALAYRRAGSTLLDVLVVFSIPVVAVIGLLTGPEPDGAGVPAEPLAIEAQATGSIAPPPEAWSVIRAASTASCNRGREKTI
jgi:hypothetical protein